MSQSQSQSQPGPPPDQESHQPAANGPEEMTVGAGTVIALGCIAITLLVILVGFAISLLTG